MVRGGSDIADFRLPIANWLFASQQSEIGNCQSAITGTSATADGAYLIATRSPQIKLRQYSRPPYHTTRLTGHYFFRMLITANPARDQARELFVGLEVNQGDV